MGDISNYLNAIASGLNNVSPPPDASDPGQNPYGFTPYQMQQQTAQANAARQAAYAAASQPVVARWGGGGTLPTADAAQSAGAKAYYDAMTQAQNATQAQGTTALAQQSAAIANQTSRLGLNWNTLLQGEKIRGLLGGSSGQGMTAADSDLLFGRTTSNDPTQLYSVAQKALLTFPDQAKGLQKQADDLRAAQLKAGVYPDGPMPSPTPPSGPQAATGTTTATDPAASVSIPAQPAGGISPSSGQAAYRNNNPGNLKFAGQNGASQGDAAADGGNFAKFDTPQAGFNALVSQIKTSAMQGKTVGGYLSSYATDPAYTAKVTSALGGIDPSTPLSKVDAQMVAQAQAKIESQTTLAPPKGGDKFGNPVDANGMPILEATTPPKPTGNFVTDQKAMEAYQVEQAKPPVNKTLINANLDTMPIDVSHQKVPKGWFLTDDANLPPDIKNTISQDRAVREKAGLDQPEIQRQQNALRLAMLVQSDPHFASGRWQDISFETRSLASSLGLASQDTVNAQEAFKNILARTTFQEAPTLNVSTVRPSMLGMMGQVQGELGSNPGANRAAVLIGEKLAQWDLGRIDAINSSKNASKAQAEYFKNKDTAVLTPEFEAGVSNALHPTSLQIPASKSVDDFMVNYYRQYKQYLTPEQNARVTQMLQNVRMGKNWADYAGKSFPLAPTGAGGR